MPTFKGFDDFAKKLQKKIDQVSGEKSLETIFSESFMRKYTEFNNIQEFFDKSPFKIETQEDFDNLDQAELDKYVRKFTRFGSWAAMKQKAGEEYFAKHLKF